jgi:uncharacterized protein (DUF934 family)
MALIKNGQPIEDTWTRIEGEAPLPTDGDVIIDAVRLKDDPSVLSPRNGHLGVHMPNTGDPLDLAPALDRLALVSFEFPSFNDGRAFSQARVLRHQMGFKGEIRATGKPIPDQVAHLIRCGFDVIEASPRHPLETWRRALGVVTHVYQRDYSTGAGSSRSD